MPVPKIIILLTVIAGSVLADDITARVDRHGRRIQVDGFLLEWKLADANTWGDSPWVWDAIITPDGVAGYFSSRGAAACSSWTFSINAVGFDGDDRKYEMKIPEASADKIFAFDKSGFENGGIYNTEWLIPWSAFNENGSAYILVLDAANDCGERLRSLLLFINRENQPAGLPHYYIAIVIICFALAAVFIVGGKKFKSRKVK